MHRPAHLTRPASIAFAFAGGLLLVALTSVAYSAIWHTALAASGAAHVYAEWGMAAGWFTGDGSAIAANRLDVRGVVIGVIAGVGLLGTGLYGLRACTISWRSILVALHR